MEKIKDVISFFESLAPKSSQESYDNSGLLVGNSEEEVRGILVCLDSTEDVIQEAMDKGCNLVISHHPIIFKGLKSITGKNYVERVVLKCIQNNIALYAIHTNLDNYRFGVNDEIAKRLGLTNTRVLAPKDGVLSKLVFYAPEEHYPVILDAIYKVGAGNIGNYTECSFSVKGDGTFKPNDLAQPFEGEYNVRSNVNERRVEVLVSNHIRNKVIQAMIETHPYEEVAYELIPVLNKNQDEGSGVIGELAQGMQEEIFLRLLKNTFKTGIVRHTSLLGKPIRKVAVCGGSGSFLLTNAIQQQADVFVTADFKYHEFFDAEDKIVIADIGHYESEQFTINRIADFIKKNFPKFAVHLTGVNTNPINYF